MDRSSINKHNIIIQTTARDEYHIINEFIVHHILLGIDHIYIYDDGSIIHISEKIKELPSWMQQKVTVYRFDNSFNFYDINSFKKSNYFIESIYEKYKTRKQLYFMNHFLINNKNKSKWCAFLDSDEFIYLKNEQNIKSLLLNFDNFDCIHIPWIYYGTSYHIDQPDGLVMDNFTYHSNTYSDCGKSFAKLSSINNIECVHLISTEIKRHQLNYSSKLYELPIHINHYITNSVKTYLKRKLRNNIGQPNGNIRNASEFYNTLCGCNNLKDYIMHKYVDGVNDILKKIKNTETNITEKKYNLLKNKNDVITNCQTREVLENILNDNTIEYCNESDLPRINDKRKSDKINDVIKNHYNSNIQMSLIAINQIAPNCIGKKMLVFGLGHDSNLWYNLTNCNTFFVEDKKEYIDLNKKINDSKIVHYTYRDKTKVKNSFTISMEALKAFKVPDVLLKEAPFDVILIDGPEGWNDECPGRILPIFWSKTVLSKKGTIVYVDDCNRPLEKHCINQYFKENEKTHINTRLGLHKILI